MALFVPLSAALQKNVEVLQARFGKNTTVLLRTAPVSHLSVVSGYFNILEANAAIRLLGTIGQVGVIDWALMLQSLPSADVYTDWIHVEPMYQVRFCCICARFSFASVTGSNDRLFRCADSIHGAFSHAVCVHQFRK